MPLRTCFVGRRACAGPQRGDKHRKEPVHVHAARLLRGGVRHRVSDPHRCGRRACSAPTGSCSSSRPAAPRSRAHVRASSGASGRAARRSSAASAATSSTPPPGCSGASSHTVAARTHGAACVSAWTERASFTHGTRNRRTQRACDAARVTPSRRWHKQRRLRRCPVALHGSQAGSASQRCDTLAAPRRPRRRQRRGARAAIKLGRGHRCECFGLNVLI
jgi:hypothetical protein